MLGFTSEIPVCYHYKHFRWFLWWVEARSGGRGEVRSKEAKGGSELSHRQYVDGLALDGDTGLSITTACESDSSVSEGEL